MGGRAVYLTCALAIVQPMKLRRSASRVVNPFTPAAVVETRVTYINSRGYSRYGGVSLTAIVNTRFVTSDTFVDSDVTRSIAVDVGGPDTSQLTAPSWSNTFGTAAAITSQVAPPSRDNSTRTRERSPRLWVHATVSTVPIATATRPWRAGA